MSTSAVADRERGKCIGYLPTDRKPVARTKFTGKVPFIAAWVEGGWVGWDGSARPWQLALGHAWSVARARVGADDAASGCCNSLVWGQRVPGVVL
jgi:hypothetical protein